LASSHESVEKPGAQERDREQQVGVQKGETRTYEHRGWEALAETTLTHPEHAQKSALSEEKSQLYARQKGTIRQTTETTIADNLPHTQQPAESASQHALSLCQTNRE
jgi:hypothetical protein